MWPSKPSDKKPTKDSPSENKSDRSWRTFKKINDLENRSKLGALSVSTHGVYPSGSLPSPNDSGVSSQSLTSSPHQSPRVKKDLRRTTTQDSGIYSRSSTLNNKSDTSSGRSSPWTPTRPPSQKANDRRVRTSTESDIDALVQLSENDFYRADPISCYDNEDRNNNDRWQDEQSIQESFYDNHSRTPRSSGLYTVVEQDKKDFSSKESTPKRRIVAPTLRTAKRKSLDLALAELEKIYQSLQLNDDMIMDGAERRDLPARIYDILEKQHTLKRPAPELYGSYDSLVCPRRGRRRSGIPDKVRDDAAHRRFRNITGDPCNSKQPTQSYLLCSPTFTPTIDVEVMLKELIAQPDIEHDDLSYRTYKHADGAKVPAAHPPFGIPISPACQSSSSHYIHLQPGEISRPFLKPREAPDVSRDDLAFRALRKDFVPPRVELPRPRTQSTPNLNGSSHRSPRLKSCKKQEDSSRHWVKDLEMLLSTLN